MPSLKTTAAQMENDEAQAELRKALVQGRPLRRKAARAKSAEGRYGMALSWEENQWKKDRRLKSGR